LTPVDYKPHVTVNEPAKTNTRRAREEKNKAKQKEEASATNQEEVEVGEDNMEQDEEEEEEYKEKKAKLDELNSFQFLKLVKADGKEDASVPSDDMYSSSSQFSQKAKRAMQKAVNSAPETSKPIYGMD